MTNTLVREGGRESTRLLPGPRFEPATPLRPWLQYDLDHHSTTGRSLRRRGSSERIPGQRPQHTRVTEYMHNVGPSLQWPHVAPCSCRHQHWNIADGVKQKGRITKAWPECSPHGQLYRQSSVFFCVAVRPVTVGTISSVLRVQTPECSEYHPSEQSPVVSALSLSYQAPRIWNQLPASVRHSTTSVHLLVLLNLPLKTFSKTFSFSVPLPWGVCACVCVRVNFENMYI